MGIIMLDQIGSKQMVSRVKQGYLGKCHVNSSALSPRHSLLTSVNEAKDFW